MNERLGIRRALSDARHRPGYPPDLFSQLARLHSLSRSSVAIDAGCGTGQLAMGLSQVAGQVVGVDRDPAMIRVAKRRYQAAKNITWIDRSIDTLAEEAQEYRANLICFGRCLHQFDPADVCAFIRAVAAHECGVAVMGDSPLRAGPIGRTCRSVKEIVRSEFVELDSSYFKQPHDQTIQEAGFRFVAERKFRFQRHWDEERIVGQLAAAGVLPPDASVELRRAVRMRVKEEFRGFSKPLVENVTLTARCYKRLSE